MNGEIRSAYVMTEPDVASSDAKNLQCLAVLDGDEWVINGDKYYASGAGDPRCKILIVMLLTSPDGPPSRKHSQILVPMDTPGVQIVGPMEVFGEDDAPHGHMHLRFNNVRVPKKTSCLVKDVASKFLKSVWGLDVSTTACVQLVQASALSS